jgi:YD repeat-containing protein
MGVESPTYINQLNSAWPLSSDDRSTADDHLRLIKAAVLATFPAITGAVSASHAELNLNVGNTKTIGPKLAQFSLSISALNAGVSALTTNVNSISNTISVMNARLVSMSAIDTSNAARFASLSIDVVKFSLSISALHTNVNAVSNTVSVMAVRINTLSVSVSVVQAALTAFPATERTWSAQQIAKSGSLTDSVSIAWDCDANGQIVSVTLAGNRTMEAPTNISPNACYILKCIQDATGSRTLTWNAAFHFPNGTDAVLSTTAGAVDILSFLGGTGVMYCLGVARDIK